MAEGQLYVVENYWEAAGVMSALRAGIDPDAVRRPITRTRWTGRRSLWRLWRTGLLPF